MPIGLRNLQGLRICMRVDGAAFDPTSADVFAANADGTLTVIHQDGADQYHVAQTVTTPRFSRNLGLDSTRDRIFVAAAKFGPTPAGGRGRGPLIPGFFVCAGDREVDSIVAPLEEHASVTSSNPLHAPA